MKIADYNMIGASRVETDNSKRNSKKEHKNCRNNYEFNNETHYLTK